MTANNSAKNYSVSGSGAISGTSRLVVGGNGVLTLATANTYTGGTTLSSGQLNLNHGGNGSSSAIGTGTFTINGGTIDNTSGGNVTLISNNAQNWNSNFVYAGASNSLDLGTGTVTVGGNLTLTVNGNTLTTGGAVDGHTVTKAGNGVWTIGGGNSADDNSLGIILNAGTVNLNKTAGNSHCVGGGGLVINGGTARITGTGGQQIYTGAPVTLAAGGTFDLYGHSDAGVAYLAGYGGIVDNTAAGTLATLTNLSSSSSSFGGTIQNSGSGAQLALAQAGPGTLTLTGQNTYSSGTMQPVPTANMPVFAYITAYDVNEQTVTNAAGAAEPPLYNPYDSCTTIGGNVVETAGNDAWWDNLVAEQLQARLPVVLLSTCGAYTTNAADLNGPGNINPRRLKYWWNAVQRAGATNLFQTGCFAEAAAQGIYQNHYGLPAGALYDFANTDAWNQVWWLRIIKPWFDNVPSNTWYYLNGGVPIECWGLNITSIYTNQQGNISEMFNFIATNMQATYGIVPRFIMGSINCDTTLSNCQWFVGDNEWFGPPSTPCTMTAYKGYTWGGMVAGYINPSYYGSPTNANYMNSNAVVPRNGVGGTGQNGDSFKAGFNAAVSSNAIFTMIEGYTDVSESCGPYRSLSTNWSWPNQYLDILRSYADLRTVTLKLEAEGCDAYANATGNPGGAYRRTGTLGIRALPGSGWAVTGTVAGEWIAFTNFQFSPGNYKFPVRYSATAAHVLQLYVDGVALPAVSVPPTGDLNTFNIIYLGTNVLAFGQHTFQLTLVDGGVDVDWLFVKKYDPLMSFKSSLNGCYLTAIWGGNAALAATNNVAIGDWELFSVDDLAGGGTVTGGDTVNIQAYNGLYITAVSGGGGQILATQRAPGSNERLTIVKLNGSGALVSGDSVAFRTPNGSYLTVASNGTADASGAAIGAAQTFYLDAIDSQ